MAQDILEILRQFGAGPEGDPGNSAVRFLLAAFFWLGLGLVSLQQYRRLRSRRDFFICIAAAFGLARENTMFLLEYGASRNWLPFAVSHRIYPPLEHTLANFAYVFLGFAYLTYFIPKSRAPRFLLRSGIGIFAGLYLITAPLWTRFLDTQAALHPGLDARYSLFWGDPIYHIAAASIIAAIIAALLRAHRMGRRIPPALYAAFSFLFLDELLMATALSFGLEEMRILVTPIRHNLHIWSIPLFIWTYWGEVLRRLQEEKARSEGTLAALAESEERYRTLVQNIEYGITLIDTGYRILMANAAHGRMLQRPSENLVGQQCFRAFHGRESACPNCPGMQAIATAEKAIVEKSSVRKDGSPIAVLIQAFPVRAPDGTVRGFIELVEDVTERKKLETEQKQLEERMLQAQKLESLGILAGGIAHDFNNLLMGILGNADLALLKTTPESPVRPFLNSIDTAAQRAADLTNQMLAYSGRGRFVVEAINLSRLVEEMGHLLTTVVSKRASLRYHLDADLPPVEADATQIRQVVMNLLTNASDALAEREGVVTVTTGIVEADTAYLAGALVHEALPKGRYAFVEVSDTGSGMAPEIQARIFDPFFTTKHAGRGLGLAAVLGIVRGHRGGIKVYSEPGRGTTIKVLLPAIDGNVRSIPSAAVPAAAAQASARGRGTVLLVDDEELVRVTARGMLEELGYTVIAARDGIEALEIFQAKTGEIAIVLLDMTMPRLGGEETFREIRHFDPRVPVILSSGFNERDAVNRFTGKGLAGFIQKPYRSQTLAEKIGEAIADRQGGA